ncbi:thrombomodulin [Heptranchias perlo]|uniref:thrombomodulin n=1 Tax=Heptranchias perlo TaxID=212740 RepID=UPI003559721D
MLGVLIYVIALVPLVHSERSKQQPEESVPTICVGNFCYSLQRERRKFNMARNICKGGLGDAMTVRSTVAAEAISVLLQSVSDHQGENFWIGLQLHQKTCPGDTTRLRAYRWVDGDSNSDYSNWGALSTTCGPRCVTVSKGGTWQDRPCNEKVDGVLCEFRYDGMCKSLRVDNGSLTYRTPFGTESSDLSELPPGTVASVAPSGLRFECKGRGNGTWAWDSQTPAPWDCEVENGGCDHTCESQGGPRCRCFPGHELNQDNQSCSLVDPCQGTDCQHFCFVESGSPFCMCQDGYRLAADGRRCEDVDECMQNPCEQRCVNTAGSFACQCFSGFYLSSANKCEDINECAQTPGLCQHKCANTIGSFNCICYSRYELDPNDQRLCIFHCETNTNPCEARGTGDRLDCPVGYILDDDVKKCFDINECNSDMCDHLCTNTFGSFKCACQPGYQLQADGTTCESEDGSGSSDTIPTSEPTLRPTLPTDHVAGAGLSLGVVLGSIFAIAVVILILAGLGHHLLKKRGKWQTSTKYKSANLEQDVNLSQVTSGDDHKQQSQYTDDKSNVGT